MSKKECPLKYFVTYFTGYSEPLPGSLHLINREKSRCSKMQIRLLENGHMGHDVGPGRLGHVLFQDFQSNIQRVSSQAWKKKKKPMRETLKLLEKALPNRNKNQSQIEKPNEPFFEKNTHKNYMVHTSISNVHKD